MTTKRIIALLMCLVLLFLFVACGETSTHNISDYYLETEYKPDFRILQLTDIHLANKDNRKYQYDFLDLVIRDAKADMIVIAGDIFTFADKRTAIETFDFLDSYGIPWTLTFGNHDEQCYFPVDWLTEYLNNYGSNCLFRDIHGDDVFGYANFAINLKENGKVHTQVILLDSNRYNFGEYLGYDYIKKDQIDWYERLVKDTTENNGGVPVPSLLFFHIPLPEFDDAWDASQKGDPDAILEYGDKHEKCCPPDTNSGLFNKALELGSTIGIFVGHDHVNNFRIKYKGIYLSYNINSTDRIYYEDDLLGGQVIVIHEDNTLSFEAITHKYEEVGTK